MARGSVVDEPALIEALQNRTIYSAGLDVFANEPDVPKELIAMDHIVLFHLGSSTEATRAAMDQLVVDNILAWAAGKPSRRFQKRHGRRNDRRAANKSGIVL